jgi:hypothetical protein
VVDVFGEWEVEILKCVVDVFLVERNKMRGRDDDG